MSAVHVVQLHKHFTRRKRPPVVALDDVSFTIAPRRVRRRARPERLGQVDARAPALDAAAARRRQRARVRPRRRARRARRARLVNRVSVEASFFKRMSAAREPLLRRALLRPRRRARPAQRIPEILERVGFPGDRATRADGGPLARHAAEGRAGAGAADLADAAAARRADHRPGPALQARGAGLHPRACAAQHDTTTLLCTHDMAEAEALADRVGILDRGRLLALEPARARCKRRYARRHARGRVHRRHRPRVRGRSRSRGGGVMRGAVPRCRRSRCAASSSATPTSSSATAVGAGVLRLDGRQHAHDRVHRRRRGGDAAASSTSSARRRSC